MNLADLGRFLLLSGVILIVLGLSFILYAKFPFLGRLPGDIHWTGRNFSFHFPIVTCIVLSIIITIVFNLIARK